MKTLTARQRIGATLASLALLAPISVAVAAPASATVATTAFNSGSSAIVIQLVGGGIRTLYPGQSVGQAAYLLRPQQSCFWINGNHGCAFFADKVWLSDGYKNIRRA